MPESNGIFYTDSGTGKPIVLIHGFCETHHVWKFFQAQLTKNYRVISIDLPGFGASKILPGEFSISDVAQAVVRFIQAKQLDKPVILGHSLGGYVALSVAEQYGEHISAFGLIHSTAQADSAEKKVSRNKVIEFISNHGVKPFIDSFIPPLFHDRNNPEIKDLMESASQTPRETVIGYTRAMRDRDDKTTVLKDWQKPFLLIAGESDPGLPVETLKKQAELAKMSSFLVFSQVGHMGMLEKPTDLLSGIIEFVNPV